MRAERNLRCSELPIPLSRAYIERFIGISGSLIWSKTLMELLFRPIPYGEFR